MCNIPSAQTANDYFLSVFTRENQDTIPVEVFQGEDNEKLNEVIITGQVVQEEIEKLKRKVRQEWSGLKC